MRDNAAEVSSVIVVTGQMSASEPLTPSATREAVPEEVLLQGGWVAHRISDELSQALI
jgi:hypothetical protein